MPKVNKNLKIKHKMTNELLKISRSKNFFDALEEFFLVKVKEFKKGENKDRRRCLCHGVLSRKMYVIQNIFTNTKVFVGKKCFKMFKLKDLERNERLIQMRKTPTIGGQIVDFKLLNNMMVANDVTEDTIQEHQYINTCNRVIEKIGGDVFDFGRYKGKSVYDVVGLNRHYIAFILSDRFVRRIKPEVEYLFVD